MESVTERSYPVVINIKYVGVGRMEQGIFSMPDDKGLP